MAATEDDKTTHETKVKDDDSKKDKKIGQKATTYAGIEIPVKDDDDKVPAKISGKTSGEAEQDDAARTSGKTSGKAGKDDAARNLGKAEKPMVKLEKMLMATIKKKMLL